MELAIIIGNIFGGLSSFVSSISVHSKTREKMLIKQNLASLLGALSYIVLGGIMGAFACFIAIFRNTLESKGKNNKYLTGGFIAITTIWFIYNYRNIYDIFPFISSVIYTLALLTCKDYKVLKVILAINNILGFIYCMSINSYIVAFVQVILFVNTLVAIKRTKTEIIETV